MPYEKNCEWKDFQRILKIIGLSARWAQESPYRAEDPIGFGAVPSCTAVVVLYGKGQRRAAHGTAQIFARLNYLSFILPV